MKLLTVYPHASPPCYYLLLCYYYCYDYYTTDTVFQLLQLLFVQLVRLYFPFYLGVKGGDPSAAYETLVQGACSHVIMLDSPN